MKKALWIVGVVSLVACALCLAFAALNLFGYHNVLDGSAELYGRLHQRSVVYLIAGLALGAVGTACMVIRRKK